MSVALTACYEPAHDIACTVSCSATAPCPGNLQCGADLLCRDADQSDCTSTLLPDAPDGPTCLGTLLQVRVCASPTAPISLPATVSTDTDCTFTQAQQSGKGPMLCVIAGTSVDVQAVVAVRGSLPLLVFATDSIVIAADASIDVASHRNVKTGPGTRACGTNSGQASDGTFGGGGGAGGAFQGAGGDGGDGASFNAIKSNGAVGSLPIALDIVEGGCNGGSGGGNNIGDGGGTAGSGGGAVYLLAGSSISVAGTINASGSSGGRGTLAPAGGGGAGAGGLVVLDAPMLQVTGTILASGAGGGGAASTSTAATGDGCEPDITKPQLRACGGTGGAPAGNGGLGTGVMAGTIVLDGGSGLNANVDGSDASGGGGGGGGAGHVLLSSPLVGAATIFPPPG